MESLYQDYDKTFQDNKKVMIKTQPPHHRSAYKRYSNIVIWTVWKAKEGILKRARTRGIPAPEWIAKYFPCLILHFILWIAWCTKLIALLNSKKLSFTLTFHDQRGYCKYELHVIFAVLFDSPIARSNIYGTLAPGHTFSGTVVIRFWGVLSPEV